MDVVTDTAPVILNQMPDLRNISEVAIPMQGYPMTPELTQLLIYAAFTGLSVATIKKGVDLLNYVFGLVVIVLAMHNGGTQPITTPQLPGAAKSLLTLAITLVLPPAAYAVLVVDSGLSTFDPVKLTAAVGVAFAAAWAWYQNEKHSTNTTL